MVEFKKCVFKTNKKGDFICDILNEFPEKLKIEFYGEDNKGLVRHFFITFKSKVEYDKLLLDLEYVLKYKSK